MQRKNHIPRTFSERTDILSERLGVTLRELAPIIGISQAMLFGYRTGKYVPTNKALGKLLAAESKLDPPLREDALAPENHSSRDHSDASGSYSGDASIAPDARELEALGRAVTRRQARLDAGLEAQLARTVAEIELRLGQFPNSAAAVRRILKDQIATRVAEYEQWCEALAKAEEAEP